MTSLLSIYQRFPTHDHAATRLECVRWPDGPICPYCGSPKASAKNEVKGKALAARRWQCQTCKRSYSVTVNTIFHNSHIGLQHWFMLIALMLNAKMSATQASRELEMRRPTVWSMMHRIRSAMGREDEGRMLSSLVEFDEASIGGRSRKANDRDDDGHHRPPSRSK